MKSAFWNIDVGDCRELMRAMEPESVQCVVTSPPFYGLRDYGHDGQIGLEETPEDYIDNLVAVFTEVWRVLRSDGTLWLNLGDSYNAGNPLRAPSATEGYGKHSYVDGGEGVAARAFAPNLKPKDLIGIPWRVAFALQKAGWYLRSEIIWAKPNPMPESITDRPTKAHEQLFLLTKSERYFYDAHAVREEDAGHRSGNGFAGRQGGSERVSGRSGGEGSGEWKPGAGRNRRGVWEVPEEAWAQFLAWLEAQPPELRDLWGIATVPFKAAHFATFPPKLVDPCVKAGTPEAGSCPECAAPRRRVVQKVRLLDGEPVVEGGWDLDEGGRIGAAGVGHWRYEISETLGWVPTCACGAPEGVEPDDLEPIRSPTGEGPLVDPSLEVGRAGYARPRNDNGGRRTITRYQQRCYAEQLKRLPSTAVAKLIEERHTTRDAWAHYCRTDRGGARPLPPLLLAHLLEIGHLAPVEPPEWEPPEPVPAVVFDPFAGAGTTGVAALRLDRSFVGCELNEDYAELARRRVRDDAPLFNVLAEGA